LARLQNARLHVVKDPRDAERCSPAAGKRRLVLRRRHGSFLDACPAGTAGLVCCNYLALNLGSGCPLDCSYCFLQEYVANNPVLKVFTNIEDALAQVDAVIKAHPQRAFRVGTGELADSLALDRVTAISRHLVPFFAGQENALLELKTKTDCIEELLHMDPNDRVVVSWSVNALPVTEADEPRTAPLRRRLEAARCVQEAGYRTGFHLDPLVEFDGWEREYRRTVEEVFAAVDLRRVAWVSLGSLRLTPGLRRIMRLRGVSGPAAQGELVPCADGKVRVWRGLRLRMYRRVLAELRRLAPGVPVYLCMEPPDVWKRIMGEVPGDRALGQWLAREGVR